MTDPEPVVHTTGQNRSSLVSAFGFTVLAQLVQGGVRLACFVLLGRVAGKETLGEVSALLAMSTFLVLSWPQPVGAAASRFVSMANRHANQQRAIESFTSKSALVACGPLCLVSGIITVFWFDARWPVVIWSTLLPACLGVAVYVRGARNGRLRFRQGFLWDSVGAAATLVTMTMFVLAGGFDHALLALCIGFLVSALPGWPRGQAEGMPVESRREVVRYTAWTSIQVIAAGGLIHLVMALTAFRASPSELGEMGAAVSIATPALLLAIALRTSTVPFLARQVALGENEGLRRATDLLMRSMVTGFIPIFGVACIWSEELLDLLYSQSFARGATLLVVLLLGVSLNCFNASHIWLISGPSWGARVLAICNGAGFSVGLVVAFWGSTIAPTTGAAVGFLVGSLVSSGSALLVVWRRGNMHWSPLIARVTTGYLLIVASLLGTDGAGPLTRIIVTTTFLAVYAGLSGRDIQRISRLAPWNLRQAS